MGYWKGAKNRMVEDSVVNRETVKDIEALPFRANEERGISQETCERFGVRCAVSTSDGVTPEAYYFPSYNKKGKIVGYMKQDVTKDKEEPRHWTAVGSVSISNKLFGQDVAESVERRKTNIIITEGQWDCLSVYQAARDNVKGTKWESLEPFVVSIPLGTANAAESVLQNFQYISSFNEVTVFFDNDEATPAETKKGILRGREASEAVFSTLVGEGIGLFQIEAVEPHKDSSDYLQAGEWRELAKLISFGRKEYTPEKIVKISDVSLEDILAKKKDGIMVPEFPELMKMIRGLRVGELVTITSSSGCVDKDTEFFDGKGWKPISEYQEGDFVGQYTEEGKLELVYPEEYIKLPCDEFYHLKSRGLDMVLSGEHDVVYFNRGTNSKDRPFKISVDDLVKRHEKNKYGFPGKIKTVFSYGGEGLNITEGELRLQVAVMADGRIVKGGKDNYTQMRFSKERKYKRLLWLCKTFGLKYKDNSLKSDSKDSSNTEYEVIVWPKWDDKKFTEKYYQSSKEQLEIICDEVFHWDGSICNSNDEGKVVSPRYSSRYVGDVDFIQFALASIGVRATVGADIREGKTPSYWLSKNQRQQFLSLSGGEFSGKHKQEILKTPSKDGLKYCFTVPSGMLVLRREGKIFVTGNSGKSTSTSILADAVMKSGHKAGLMFLEENKEETIQRFLAKRLKVSYVDFKENPLGVVTHDKIQSAYEELIAQDQMVILDHFGSIPVEDLMSRVKYMHYIEKCDFIFIDHAGMLTANANVQDERRTLDIVITELAAFCASNPCGIVLISHINRSAAEQFKPPRLKDGEEPQPYWIQVSKEMMRSSAALEQLSWIVLGLEPEIMPNRERGRVRWVVLKNRTASSTGVADTFKLNQQTWEVELFDNED